VDEIISVCQIFVTSSRTQHISHGRRYDNRTIAGVAVSLSEVPLMLKEAHDVRNINGVWKFSGFETTLYGLRARVDSMF
jgi:hypothetical protein